MQTHTTVAAAKAMDAKPDEVQMDQQDGTASLDKRRKSESMQVEQTGPVELLEKEHKGSASTTCEACGTRTRRSTETAPGDDNSSIIIQMDVRRAYFSVQARPNTYVEVLDEVQLEGRRCDGSWSRPRTERGKRREHHRKGCKRRCGK